MSWIQEKLEWGKSLKIGDLICDFRAKHFKIIEITPEYVDGILDDFLIMVEDGICSSLIHDCDDPNDHTIEDHEHMWS